MPSPDATFETKWFKTYCPKIFAAIGGLSGSLLDRCIVLHMERTPIGHKRLISVEEDFVAQDVIPLVKNSKLLPEGGAHAEEDLCRAAADWSL